MWSLRITSHVSVRGFSAFAFRPLIALNPLEHYSWSCTVKGLGFSLPKNRPNPISDQLETIRKNISDFSHNSSPPPACVMLDCASLPRLLYYITEMGINNPIPRSLKKESKYVPPLPCTTVPHWYPAWASLVGPSPVLID